MGRQSKVTVFNILIPLFALQVMFLIEIPSWVYTLSANLRHGEQLLLSDIHIYLESIFNL